MLQKQKFVVRAFAWTTGKEALPSLREQNVKPNFESHGTMKIHSENCLVFN